MPLETQCRPRVEGDREQEILSAALEVIAEVGYDRLTMDAVASAARASKATLYRRWSDKTTLVLDALRSVKSADRPVPDTGDLREDLIASFCGPGSLTDPAGLATFTSVLTAITRDPEFAEAFRREVVAPKLAAAAEVYARALARGELRDDLDLEIAAPALAGVLLHRYFLLGERPDRQAVERVVDALILPAVRRPA